MCPHDLGQDVLQVGGPDERLGVVIVGVDEVLNRRFELFDAVEAAAQDGTLAVTGRSLPGSYEVTVRDSGPGIPESDREKVFEPFFTTKKSGLGLGLAIVQRIVTEHGGKIYLKGDTQSGTAFMVSLPTAGDKEEKP